MAVTVSRGLRLAVGAPLALIVLVAGFLLFHGDFGRWSDNSALDDACAGLLDRSAVRGVLGTGDADVEGLGGALAHCRVTVEGGGSAEIQVDDTAQALRSAAGVPAAGGDGLAVPVGHGWSGLFNAEFDTSRPEQGNGVEGTVLLLLTCTGTGGPDGLAVSVRSTLDGSLDDPANRPRYARIATSTAAEAAKAQHCATQLGSSVKSLGLPVTKDQYQPIGSADGTCAGLSAARGLRVATETARGGAPTEMCRLADTAGTLEDDLTAFFGPYAEEELRYHEERGYGEGPTHDRPARQRTADGRVGWTSAECLDGRALFTVRVGTAGASGSVRKPPSAAADLVAERTLLTAFAARSAKAHGCSAPRPIPAG
ncbi:hypothetical protein ACIREE_05185 [Streptomyces sp. NPDC102467]|uniref:hypothetical protein n=1 Tax=Streptomyces sp. NPDC102467 TaxID=3366179 RepID=UPI003803839B